MNRDAENIIPHAWLQACPGGLLVLHQGRPVWANAGLGRMLGLPTGAVTGKDLEGAAFTSLAGAGEVVVVAGMDGAQRRLACRRTALLEPPGTGLELLAFEDLDPVLRLERERDELARKVEELTLTDALTGLANRRALGHALGAQVTRSRRYHNPLSIALVEMRVPGLRVPFPDPLVLAVSRFLRDRLRWADIIGRYADELFLLILPETGQEAAQALLRDICEEAAHLELPVFPGVARPQLRLGIAEWHKGLDATRLVEAARKDLGAVAAVD